jgi:hypothetical protein
MTELNKFYKITIQDNDMSCYNLKPFSFYELNEKTKLEDDTTISSSMRNRAINTFKYMSNNSTNAEKCCDINDTLSKPEEFAMFNDFIIQYPKYRNIIENSKLKYIELTTDNNKLKSENWENIDALTFCRITKALSNNSLITPTDDSTVFVVSELLSDCTNVPCNPDSYHTIEDLFKGSITSSGEFKSSRVFDKEIYYGIKNKSLTSLIKYINEFNDVNRIITYQGNKYRLLNLAAQYYDEKIMNAILAMKPNLDLKDSFGNTALHNAIIYNNYYAVEKLLEAGISKNIKDKNGMTPIMLLLTIKTDDKIFNNYAYLTLLHNSGADLFELDNDKNTMLHIAIINEVDNIINIVNYLIDNGIETNVKNKFNKTPLQIINEKTAHLNNNPNNNFEKINKKDAALLTVQTLIFNSIIRNNPSKYSEYININDLDSDIPLLNIINYKCVGNNVLGTENKDECLLKGGEYKLLNNSNVSVKFNLNEISEINNIDDNNLYIPKLINRTEIDNHPLIKKINENALNSIMHTSNEEQHSGEYITRDIVETFQSNYINNNPFLSTSKKTELNKTKLNFSNKNYKNNYTQHENNKITKLSINENNIAEGFNNSINYLNNQKKKDILILIITICLIIIFIIFLYKLTI